MDDTIYCRASARWFTRVHKSASGLTETVWRRFVNSRAHW